MSNDYIGLISENPDKYIIMQYVLKEYMMIGHIIA